MTIQILRPHVSDICYAKVFSQLEHEPKKDSIVLRILEPMHTSNYTYNTVELAFESRDSLLNFHSSISAALAAADKKSQSL